MQHDVLRRSAAPSGSPSEDPVVVGRYRLAPAPGVTAVAELVEALAVRPDSAVLMGGSVSLDTAVMELVEFDAAAPIEVYGTGWGKSCGLVGPAGTLDLSPRVPARQSTCVRHLAACSPRVGVDTVTTRDTADDGDRIDPSVHTFDSTRYAYDAAQGYGISDGDVLAVSSEGVVGIPWVAWPLVATVFLGKFHGYDGDLADEDDGRYAASVARACEIATAIGTGLRTVHDAVPIRQGSA